MWWIEAKLSARGEVPIPAEDNARTAAQEREPVLFQRRLDLDGVHHGLSTKVIVRDDVSASRVCLATCFDAREPRIQFIE